MKSRWPSSAMSSGLRSSVQKAMNGELRSVMMGLKRVQVLAHRAFADQELHALGELLLRLGKVGDLVIGAHACGEIAVEGQAAQQRAVPVDRPGLERGQFGEARRVARQKAGKIHEFGQSQHLGMIGELQKIVGLEPRARGLERRRRNAARELHAQIHRPSASRRRGSSVGLPARARWRSRADRRSMSSRHGRARSGRIRAGSEARISTWQWVSMKPGTTTLPATSISRRRGSRRTSRRSGRRRSRRRS